MGAESVEDEQGVVANLLEKLVVAHGAFGGVGAAEVVEQVGHGDEEDGLLVVEADIGYGGGKGGLAAGTGTAKDEPTLGGGCVLLGSLKGAFPQTAASEFTRWRAHAVRRK